MLYIFNGFIITLGLILGVGPVNSFVIKQGLKKSHVLPVVMLAAFFESSLIALGVMGMGAFITDSKFIMKMIAYIGSVFLIIYGFVSLYNAFKTVSKKFFEVGAVDHKSLKKTLSIALALLLFNPGLFIEATIVIGGIGAHFDAHTQIFFLIGSVASVFFWFFVIGYGSARISFLFASEKAWKTLEIFVAAIMFITACLLLSFYG